MKKWGRTFLNAFLSTAPVILIILILNLSRVTPFDSNDNALFAIGAILLFIGVALFSIGTENAMSKIGEIVGSHMTKQTNFAIMILIILLLGVFITIAEPDLSVLAERLHSIDNYLFIGLVGLGVGIFLVIGVLRILFQKSLKVWLLAFYALIFALAILVDESFIPLTFDSGGVTTGPVTVPFILALGVGIATTRAGKSSNADSFGLTAFCSIGPLIVVLIFGLFMGKLPGGYHHYEINSVAEAFLSSAVSQIKNVSIAMTPIIIFFFIYNAIFIHLPKKQILRIIVGLVYTYIGLIFFLTGVEGGFTPIADHVGITLVDKANQVGQWLLLLIPFAIGFVVVLCEPAVQVLVKQVEQVSDGLIKKENMLVALSIGIGVGVMLAIIRVIYNFSIFYYVVPGYIIALALTFAVPDIYVGIAFDSGGVASGPMTSAFILPFVLGVAHEYWTLNKYKIGVTEGDFIMTQAFGTVAMVAMMPLIVIQLLGLNATIEKAYNLRLARKLVQEKDDNRIIRFGE